MKDFPLTKMYLLVITTHIAYPKALQQPFNKRKTLLFARSQFAGNSLFDII